MDREIVGMSRLSRYVAFQEAAIFEPGTVDDDTFADTEFVTLNWVVADAVPAEIDVPIRIRVEHHGKLVTELVVASGYRLIADGDGVRTEPIRSEED